MPRPARTLTALAVAALLLPLAACSDSGGTNAGSSASSGDGRLQVVASTDVYGDIAATVGGDAVTVTSLINRPDQDPHSYEATVRDRLAVSRADLVIVNGGGYDPFMESLISADHVAAANVIDAVATSGLEESSAGASESPSDGHDHGAFNEHVWYSLPTAEKIVAAVKDRLAAQRPADAKAFNTNADALTAKLAALRARLAAAKSATAKDGVQHDVAITEPVPLYLLQDAGLHNVTPASFTHAVEEGGDVSPTDLNAVRTLMQQKKVALLAYNTQSESEQTRAVAAAAQSAGVPVVDFTETLPDGTHYADWMSANIGAVESALRARR
ncbi:zinc ABC transporter substrate-binding protein [Tersicoccus sp. MR15.9]|uniref:metal ABC transporter solute-binding protein, Zn/Mn family n=1 Tax=Tersicoccus mangrovi TaxID=3121635 RepID=UPI002FE52154